MLKLIFVYRKTSAYIIYRTSFVYCLMCGYYGCLHCVDIKTNSSCESTAFQWICPETINVVNVFLLHKNYVSSSSALNEWQRKDFASRISVASAFSKSLTWRWNYLFRGDCHRRKYSSSSTVDFVWRPLLGCSEVAIDWEYSDNSFQYNR